MVVKTVNTMTQIKRDILATLYSDAKIKFQKEIENGFFVVYEEFSIINGNYLTISVVVEDKEFHRIINFIPGGSSQGLFGFDFGSQKRRIQSFVRMLESKNFDYEIIEN